MKDLSEIKNHQYDFRRDVCLQRRNVNTVWDRSNCFFRSPNLKFSICEFEMFIPFKEFKKNIRKWTTKVSNIVLMC